MFLKTAENCNSDVIRRFDPLSSRLGVVAG
jgi:hypothetical protein